MTKASYNERMPDLQLLHLQEDRHPVSRPASAAGILAVVLILGAVGVGAWARSYNNRMAPNVWIGSVPVGGLSKEAALLLVQKRVDAFTENGLQLRLEDEVASLPLGTLIGGDFVEDAQMDVTLAVENAFQIGHAPNAVQSAVEIVRAGIKKTMIRVPVTLRQESLTDGLERLFPNREKPTHEARLIFKETRAGWTAEVKAGEAGTVLDRSAFLIQTKDRLETLNPSVIDVYVQVTEPSVNDRMAELAKPLALTALNNAPYTFTLDVAGKTYSYQVSAHILAKWLAPAADGSLSLDRNALTTGLAAFVKPFEKEPRNAQFRMEGSKVVGFQESQNGQKTDVAAATAILEERFARADRLAPEEKIIPLTLMEVVAAVSTEDANDLGITEPLGTGTSSYRGSPANRIKNIRNGVRILNGLLIAPGETFTAVKALAPFTLENGYLPELVIKGDKIIPELGGGLCQIGTTTFRTALNTGLPIVERRNHSIVVSYYNDQSNGLPGTDATIYEPAPDLKFTNDTGHYLMLQAEMLEDTKDLRFTLWGTSDGRKGSYTPPVVHRWIPTGPQKDIPSPDLKPGDVPKCQEAHIGADTSFEYTVTKADGTVLKETFTSHYRPLPKICLVPEGTVVETPLLEPISNEPIIE